MEKKFRFSITLLLFVLSIFCIGIVSKAYASVSDISGASNADHNGIKMAVLDYYTQEPIPGMHLVLTNSDGTIVAEGDTDVNGRYFFSDLPIGRYTVTQTTFRPEYTGEGSVSVNFDGSFFGISEIVPAGIYDKPRLGNVIVKVVDTDGNPIVGATLKATAADLAGSNIPTPAFVQTGIFSVEADGSYSLTTGADGTVVIPNLFGDTSTTIRQLTTIDGHSIDERTQVGEIIGSNTETEVVFINPVTPTPSPTPVPDTPTTPTATTEPQTQSVNESQPTLNKKEHKQEVLPNTGDYSYIVPLMSSVTGTAILIVGRIFDSKRFHK